MFSEANDLEVGKKWQAMLDPEFWALEHQAKALGHCPEKIRTHEEFGDTQHRAIARGHLVTLS